MQKVSAEFDTLKCFLQLAWETHALDTKHYTELCIPLTEAGKMLGGWTKLLQKEAPTQTSF